MLHATNGEVGRRRWENEICVKKQYRIDSNFKIQSFFRANFSTCLARSPAQLRFWAQSGTNHSAANFGSSRPSAAQSHKKNNPNNKVRLLCTMACNSLHGIATTRILHGGDESCRRGHSLGQRIESLTCFFPVCSFFLFDLMWFDCFMSTDGPYQANCP